MAERVFHALGGKALQYSRKLSWADRHERRVLLGE